MHNTIQKLNYKKTNKFVFINSLMSRKADRICDIYIFKFYNSFNGIFK